MPIWTNSWVNVIFLPYQHSIKSLAVFLLLLILNPLFANSAVLLADTHYTQHLTQRGTGEYRKFGFHVYDGTLWAATDQITPPYALQLTYHLSIKSQRIVQASLKEMRKLGIKKTQLDKWESLMDSVIPSVDKGDTITGVHTGEGAAFYLNGKVLGEISNIEFADDFFAIWLSPNTSAPKFRSLLLQRALDQ